MIENLQGAPRPRVLAVGLTSEELDRIRPLVGSLRTAQSMHDVHYEEHDVLINTQAHFSEGAGLFHRRLVFAPAATPQEEKPRVAASSGGFGGSYRELTRSRTQFRPAQSLVITEFCRRSGLESLVRRSCMPSPGVTYTGFSSQISPERTASIFIQEGLNNPLCLAAMLEDEGTSRRDSAFWLPDIARTAIDEWLQVAFRHWRLSDPDLFPQTAGWRRNERWSSTREVFSRNRIAEFDAVEARRRSLAEQERGRLLEELENAEIEGEDWRLILTASGDELVDAVAEAMTMFGFEVVHSDMLPQHKGKKREDLRLRDGDWVALAEVKGYSQAAKSNDLSQVTSASVTFASIEQRAPDCLWYIVNSYREIDPAQRVKALPDRDDDLSAFASSHGGCLIDTRDLFALRQQVALGQLSIVEAREKLRNASGRFQFSGNSNEPPV